MVSIPPTRDEDNEDVAWALQTADALWKRNERVDAVVWLRRAAQAAGDAQNDDRALSLARSAAELAEWIARHPSIAPMAVLPQPAESASGVDELLRRVEADDEITQPDLTVEAGAEVGRHPAPSSAARLSPSEAAVRTAAEAHAGMLDPWAPAEQPTRNAAAPADDTEAEIEDLDAEDLVEEDDASPGAADSRRAQGPDLSDIDALADVPDDTRATFAAAALVRDLDRGDEVDGFGLAVVLRGEVEVMAASVEIPAVRLATGAVLRGKGSVEDVPPLRLVAATDDVRLATWQEAQVMSAFGPCPWVEEELRSAADQTYALVGVTLGKIGQRLDAVLRGEITGKLKLRVLGGGEVLVEARAANPGFVLVGAGAIEHKDPASDRVVSLKAGDILFPGEVLSAKLAPSTVRASAAGALLLSCDRRVAQELLVTCPPLLEILAEG